jgi:hypothetical protein
MQLDMFSKKFQLSRPETELIKLLTSAQLGDNLFNGALHIT